MSFLNKVQRCNRRDMRRFVPFSVAGVQYGWLTPERAAVLLSHTKVFQPAAGGVALNPELSSVRARSRAIAEIAPQLVATGLFKKPRGELYAVRNCWSDDPVFRIDRAFNPGFGLRAFGVHVNGVVQRSFQPYLWIGKRAPDSVVEPDKLDNMVAGGQPADLGLMQNLIKECDEEAHIPRRLARTAQPTGVLSYSFECPEGLRVDTLFCYDLAVPVRFRPQPSEEIAQYDLMPLSKVLRLVKDTDSFKFNVNLVILDFAIRHGVITPENEPDFERIVSGLHERPSSIM
jgi:hypothetical protein